MYNPFNLFNKLILFVVFISLSPAVLAQQQNYNQPVYKDDHFKADEILQKGHEFFGTTTQELSKVIYHAFDRFGEPNAYIIGEEAGGAIVGGVRYGEGLLNLRTGQQSPVFWQGPSIGFDVGAEGSKTMMLVYNLSNIPQIFRRYPGVDGSAYVVGGVGLTALSRINDPVIIVPIRTGVGGRLGINIGYLKFTPSPTWNPF